MYSLCWLFPLLWRSLLNSCNPFSQFFRLFPVLLESYPENSCLCCYRHFGCFQFLAIENTSKKMRVQTSLWYTDFNLAICPDLGLLNLPQLPFSDCVLGVMHVCIYIWIQLSWDKAKCYYFGDYLALRLSNYLADGWNSNSDFPGTSSWQRLSGFGRVPSSDTCLWGISPWAEHMTWMLPGSQAWPDMKTSCHWGFITVSCFLAHTDSLLSGQGYLLPFGIISMK